MCVALDKIPPRRTDAGSQTCPGSEEPDGIQDRVTVSVVIPAKNEAEGLRALLPRLRDVLPDAEILVVDDGSTDDTRAVCEQHSVGVRSHPNSLGNGAAIKTGARAAAGEVLVFMDADGQHRAADVPRLLAKLDEGFDLVVGARTRDSQAGVHRAAANGFYNRLASWVVGQPILDLTSGLRAVRADKFRKFLYLLPNGFSYPTTSTMCFFRTGYPVAYLPITAEKRIGRSHLRIWRDGVRFLLIIFKIGTLYSPLKLFLPMSLGFFMTGLAYYGYTFAAFHRFTNMSALLLTTSVLVFLIGLVSEQITALNFKDSER
ncbi:MAG: glycosyltransferase family 2 protein [Betaproteobacteria bacterium]|nr:glycosyltransferase family 2 protein [Betaproteobacteria bacterium]